MEPKTIKCSTCPASMYPNEVKVIETKAAIYGLCSTCHEVMSFAILENLPMMAKYALAIPEQRRVERENMHAVAGYQKRLALEAP